MNKKSHLPLRGDGNGSDYVTSTRIKERKSLGRHWTGSRSDEESGVKIRTLCTSYNDGIAKM